MSDETIAHRLLRARLLKGANSNPPREIEHAEVAEAAGVTESAVSQWESGTKRPSRDNLPKVAAFYGVRTWWLESGELPMAAPTLASDEEPDEQVIPESVRLRPAPRPLPRKRRDDPPEEPPGQAGGE